MSAGTNNFFLGNPFHFWLSLKTSLKSFLCTRQRRMNDSFPLLMLFSFAHYVFILSKGPALVVITTSYLFSNVYKHASTQARCGLLLSAGNIMIGTMEYAQQRATFPNIFHQFTICILLSQCRHPSYHRSYYHCQQNRHCQETSIKFIVEETGGITKSTRPLLSTPSSSFLHFLLSLLQLPQSLIFFLACFSSTIATATTTTTGTWYDDQKSRVTWLVMSMSLWFLGAPTQLISVH